MRIHNCLATAFSGIVFFSVVSISFQNCGVNKFESQDRFPDSALVGLQEDQILQAELESNKFKNWQSMSRVAASSNSSSGLCEIKTVVAPGIGDGCTTRYSGIDVAFLPEVGAFKGTFTGACNKHDICFSTLGSTTDECNDDFRSDLKSACGRFSWFFRPFERSACENVARLIHAGVKLYADRNNPVPAMQAQALYLSRQLQARVENDECGSSPEREGLYNEKLIAKIKNKFLQFARREPTFYEFLQVVNFSNDIIEAPQSWSNRLEGFASAAANINPPPLNIVLSGGTLRVDPVTPGVIYAWKIDGLGIVFGNSVFVGGGNPKYDVTRNVRGAVKAWTSTGEKNILAVDTKIRIQGECASRPGQMCR